MSSTARVSGHHPETPWLLQPRLPPVRLADTVRLYCFSYAGGGAALFSAWQPRLPAHIEVCPVQLPGRENRYTEAPIRHVGELLDALEPVVAANPNQSFAFFGHSMGGRIAFELAMRLKQRDLRTPAHLLLSSVCAPHLMPRIDTPVASLPDAEFESYVLRFGGMPAAILAHPLHRQRVLDLLRADFTLNESMIHRPREPLNIAISVFGGRQDTVVSASQLAGWREHTTGRFTFDIFEGDHFFFQQDGMELLDRIAAIFAKS